MENPVRRELRERVAAYLFQVSQELGATRDDVIVGMMQVTGTVIACSTKHESRADVLAAVAEEFRTIVSEGFDKVDCAAAEHDSLDIMIPAGSA